MTRKQALHKAQTVLILAEERIGTPEFGDTLFLADRWLQLAATLSED